MDEVQKPNDSEWKYVVLYIVCIASTTAVEGAGYVVKY
jgi:hypothetical protein